MINNHTLILHCYNTGQLLGKSTGGICGLYAGASKGAVTVFNCYNNANGPDDNADGTNNIINQCGILAPGPGLWEDKLPENGGT